MCVLSYGLGGQWGLRSHTEKTCSHDSVAMLPFDLKLLFFLLQGRSAINVFNFAELEGTPSSDLSFVKLSTNLQSNLPERFIICSSHLQGRTDPVGPYQLYGEDNQPWLSFQYWDNNGNFELWAYSGKNMVRVGDVGEVHMNFWYHTCIRLSTSGEGTFEVSVNGEVISDGRDFKFLTDNKPEDLANKLVLGSSAGNSKFQNTQFFWSVTNVEIFLGSQDSWPKCGDQGNFLAWQGMRWTKNGDRIQVGHVIVSTVIQSVFFEGSILLVATSYINIFLSIPPSGGGTPKCL